jgi:hypothetical protein
LGNEEEKEQGAEEKNPYIEVLFLALARLEINICALSINKFIGF